MSRLLGFSARSEGIPLLSCLTRAHAKRRSRETPVRQPAVRPIPRGLVQMYPYIWTCLTGVSRARLFAFGRA